MKRNTLLTVMSLLSILLFSFHFVDDIVRGFESGKTSNYPGILILAVWLFATLALAHRRSGLIIIMIASLLSAGVPYIHMTRAGIVGGRIANSSGKFFWVWTLIALGTTGIVSAILAAVELWRLRRRQD